MNRLDVIIDALDELLKASNKPYLTLAAANKLLYDQGLISEFEKEKGYLKSLLEQNKLNAVQTESAPRQWRIYLSSKTTKVVEKEETPLRVTLSKKRKIKNDKNQKAKKTIDPFLIMGILAIVAVIYFGIKSHERNNPNPEIPAEIEYREVAVPSQNQEVSSPIPSIEPTKEDSTITKPPSKKTTNTKASSENVHTFKSNLNDRERNGQILETSSELMLHTIDLNKKMVIHTFQLDGVWKEIVYPFTDYYMEEGNFYTTMVLKVGVKGVKEIWWTPEVNNLGYDFYDGDRLVSYDLVRINNK